ncbi:signal transduction histidine kinase [Actinokineospora baliensis]|uniref:sensor histidine kinase n=1 Tax=Actinokineospora baliensis TaxID=547056 RepID=UPI00195601CD|nr:histidine kinase [Actinokineospora baliensis]MBM7775544.1 signal transduction histidine kinase [Actinokineospora baliensis]
MLDIVRSLWREPRPTPVPPLTWWDKMLIGVLVLAAALEGLSRQQYASTALAVALAQLLWWRRDRPLLVVVLAFGTCAVASVALDRNFPDLTALVYLLVLPFSLYRWGSGREAALGSLVMVGQVGLSVLLGYQRLPDALAGTGVLAAAMALGAAARYRTRYRARELDQVKLVERERLARDLHDTVAHHVSAMAIRAQAGIAMAAADPGAAVAALRVIDAEAGKALEEMRGMVRVLRADEPAERAPGHRLDDLHRLASDGHPAVCVEVIGDASGLPSPIGAAAYRIAQEAVTNARRHAKNATQVRVRADVGATAVLLRVTDNGDPAAPRPPGFGVTGMAERATLLGGTCTAGPDPDRGWTVAATLPTKDGR